MFSKFPMRSSKDGNKSGFAPRVLEIVRAIPKGKVLTYGQVATLAGAPRAARMVGGVLFGLGPESRVPWQRVINRQGGLSTYRIGFGKRQRELLEREGVRFAKDGHVNLKVYQWWPSGRILKKWELPDHLYTEIQKRWRL